MGLLSKNTISFRSGKLFLLFNSYPSLSFSWFSLSATVELDAGLAQFSSFPIFWFFVYFPSIFPRFCLTTFLLDFSFWFYVVFPNWERQTQ